MKLRQLILVGGIGLAAAILPASGTSQSLTDLNNNRVSDELEAKIKDGTFKRYKSLKEHADIMIIYRDLPTGDDIKAIHAMEGQIPFDGIYNQFKSVRAGLSASKIADYAKRENIMMIIADPAKD
ncbi:hypothetical protein HYX04_05840 [Candidatus Woesearchaeota archaeon]|nr:hypothetical protein [Candidatus Woesearchaeota archaeon]